jgi:hypothetical protein
LNCLKYSRAVDLAAGKLDCFAGSAKLGAAVSTKRTTTAQEGVGFGTILMALSALALAVLGYLL